MRNAVKCKALSFTRLLRSIGVKPNTAIKIMTMNNEIKIPNRIVGNEI